MKKIQALLINFWEANKMRNLSSNEYIYIFQNKNFQLILNKH